MRHTLLAAALLATTAVPPAHAAIGDTGKFGFTVSVSAFPCTPCTWSDTGSWSFLAVPVTGAPDFDHGFDGYGGADSGIACATISGAFQVVGSATDPGRNRGEVEGVFSALGAYAVVTARFYSYDFGTVSDLQGIGAVAVIPGDLRVGGLVDACDGFGPAIPANISVDGVWEGSA